MAARYMPKTLAKTLSYIGMYAPGEYGLYWDSDGTMPWKEFYWALQDDPELRFVRQSHIRELNALGLQLPFTLDGKFLRLRSDPTPPVYPDTEEIPVRLYFACRRKHYGFVLKHGLRAFGRPLLMLAGSEEFALRLARRRNREAIPLTVRAQEALAAGAISLRKAGPELYLTEAVPLEYLLCPPLREQQPAAASAPKKKESHPVASTDLPSPGSFVVEPGHFPQIFADPAASGKSRKKAGKGPEWKRKNRKERKKRTI